MLKVKPIEVQPRANAKGVKKMNKTEKKAYKEFWKKHNARDFEAESKLSEETGVYPYMFNDCPLCNQSNKFFCSGWCDSCGTTVSWYDCDNHESKYTLGYGSCWTSELKCIHSYPLPYRERFRLWRLDIKWWIQDKLGGLRRWMK